MQLPENKILEGEYEDVIKRNDHYYLLSKKHRVAVLPYTIDSKGLLDTIGIIKDFNHIEYKYDFILMNDYINEDDNTNLVTANRILFSIIGENVNNAKEWMYLGSLYNSFTSDSPIQLYCVNVSHLNVKPKTEIPYNNYLVNFEMIPCSLAITSDDTFLLASYLRLFNFFYINSLQQKINTDE